MLMQLEIWAIVLLKYLRQIAWVGMVGILMESWCYQQLNRGC